VLNTKGLGPTAIARALRITRKSVDLALVKMGLPSKAPIPEQKLLELLRDKNMDRKLAARKLGVSIRAVKRIGKKYRIRQKPDPFGLKRARVEAAIRARLAPATIIAKENRVAYRPVLRLAHRIHGPAKFIGGFATLTKPAFSSYYPQTQGSTVHHAEN
jgi:hypothetical protein